MVCLKFGVSVALSSQRDDTICLIASAHHLRLVGGNYCSLGAGSPRWPFLPDPANSILKKRFGHALPKPDQTNNTSLKGKESGTKWSRRGPAHHITPRHCSDKEDVAMLIQFSAEPSSADEEDVIIYSDCTETHENIRNESRR